MWQHHHHRLNLRQRLVDLETRRLTSLQAPPPALPFSSVDSKEKGDGKGLRRRSKAGKGGKKATGPEEEKEEEAHDENGPTQVSHTTLQASGIDPDLTMQCLLHEVPALPRPFAMPDTADILKVDSLVGMNAQVNGHAVADIPSNGSTDTQGPTAEGHPPSERANEEEEAALRREMQAAAEKQFVLLTNLIAVG